MLAAVGLAISVPTKPTQEKQQGYVSSRSLLLLVPLRLEQALLLLRKSDACRALIDYGPASSYAARSHAVSCRSTCAGAASRTSTCQRFADVCSRFATRGLRISVADFSVRMSEERRVATPANAVCRTKWIEVFFGSSVTGPSARVTSRTRRYVASTEGSFFAKCDSTLMQADCS